MHSLPFNMALSIAGWGNTVPAGKDEIIHYAHNLYA